MRTTNIRSRIIKYSFLKERIKEKPVLVILARQAYIIIINENGKKSGTVEERENVT